MIRATNKKILRATQKFSATEETRNEHGKIGAGADFQHSAFLPCSFRVSSVATSLSFVLAAWPRQAIRGQSSANRAPSPLLPGAAWGIE
jgi:hypothetical protein